MEKDPKKPVFVAISSNSNWGEMILWENGEPIKGIKNGWEFDYQNEKIVL